MATMIPAASGSMAVDDPTDLDRADYLQAFKNTMKEVKDDDVPGLAGGVAFKIFISIFPSLLAAVAIFGLVMTPADIIDLLGELRGILPGPAIELLDNLLTDLTLTKESTAGITAAIGIATGLFAATSAAVSLMKALSRAYDVPETRKIVRQRLIALAITVALVVALVGIVLLLVAGRSLQETLFPAVPVAFGWALAAARFGLALLLLIVLFAFVFWIGPNRDHPSWVWMSPGALFGVLGWLAVAGGFSLYVRWFGGASYKATYGTIAGVIVLLLWLQLSMLVILIGAEFNAEVERLRALHLRVREGAGFAVPAANAMTPGDAESGAATITETQVAAHAIHLPGVEVEPTLEMPAPTLLPPVTEAEPTVPVRTTGADVTVEIPSPASASAASGPSAAAAGTPGAADTHGVGIGTPSAGIGTPSARQAGALVASVTAVAVFLGFARRRTRR